MIFYICAAISTLDSLLEMIYDKRFRVTQSAVKSALNGASIHSQSDKAMIASIQIRVLTAAIQLSACKFQSVRVESIRIRQFRSASRKEKF